MRPTHILTAVDGSDNAERALEWAIGLAESHDAQLTLLHVVPPGGANRIPKGLEEFTRIERVVVTEQDLLRRAGERIVDAAKVRAMDHGVPKVDGVVLAGSPARTIVDVAQERDADLVVMGSRGLSDLPGLLLGSVSHKVVHAMEDGAVLVVR